MNNHIKIREKISAFDKSFTSSIIEDVELSILIFSNLPRESIDIGP